MSEGAFLLWRGVLDHPIFKAEPYTEREAWIWLIEAAAFKPHKTRVGRHVVPLERGQLAHSLRFLSGKWQWSIASVRRFLEKLENETMIDTQTGTGITLITICNYNDYQTLAKENGTPAGTQTGTEAAQSRKNGNNTTAVAEGARGIESAGALAEQIATIAGEPDPKNWPESWCGAAMRVMAWPSEWSDELCLSVARGMMAKRRGQPPPRSIKYFESAIAERYAALQSPLPEIKQGTPNEARRSVQDSAKDLASRLRGSDIFGDRPHGPGFGSGANGPPVRLLSQGGGERS